MGCVKWGELDAAAGDKTLPLASEPSTDPYSVEFRASPLGCAKPSRLLVCAPSDRHGNEACLLYVRVGRGTGVGKTRFFQPSGFLTCQGLRGFGILARRLFVSDPGLVLAVFHTPKAKQREAELGRVVPPATGPSVYVTVKRCSVCSASRHCPVCRCQKRILVSCYSFRLFIWDVL